MVLHSTSQQSTKRIKRTNMCFLHPFLSICFFVWLLVLITCGNPTSQSIPIPPNTTHSPHIQEIIKDRGPRTGGTTLTIEGAFFQSPHVFFNEVESSFVKQISQSKLEVIAPPAPLVDGVAARFVDIKVQNADGSTDVKSDAFFYYQDTFSFSSGDVISVKPTPVDFSLVDVNRDQFLDFVVASVGENAVSIFIGNGNGTFSNENAPISYAVVDPPTAIKIADVDGDGKVDLFVATQGSTPHTNLAKFFYGLGDGTFSGSLVYATSMPVLSLEIADFNGDGQVDLLEGFHQTDISKQLILSLGKTGGVFGDMKSLEEVEMVSPIKIKSVDLNQDNKLDFMVADQDRNRAKAFLGKGDGTFQPPQSLSFPSPPSDMSVADLNGDGNVDIVVLTGHQMSTFLGKGDGTFQTPATIEVGLAAKALVLIDVNLDQTIDVAIAYQDKTYAGILLNQGDASFLPIEVMPLSRNTQALLSGDLNGDGKPDLVFISTIFNGTTPLSYASVYLNQAP